MSLSTLKNIFSEINEESLLPENIFKAILKGGEFYLEDDEKYYQPVYIGFDDYDKRHNASMDQPVYFDDFDFNLKESREEIVSLMRTEYQNDTFSTIASCACGTYRANHYAGTGFICPEPGCGTPVVRPLSTNFTTKVWLRTPAKVSGFINPGIYETFFCNLKTKTPNIEIVRFWIDTKIRNQTIKKHGRSNKMIMAIHEFSDKIGIPFGYNSFIDNVDTIVMELLNSRFLSLNNQQREDYAEFWERYKSLAICHYFPVPNKIMTIVENDKRDKYYAKEQLDVSTTFQTIADMYKDDDPKSVKNEELIAPLYHKLVEALSVLRAVTIYGKRGGLRHSAGAGSLPFTGRTIISGDSGVCRSDTVWLPWLFMLTMLDKHLLSWLYRKGYTPVKARKIIVGAARKICPIVEEFADWIEDNRYVMVTVGRQPSIVYLSARSLFARFSRDIDDLSMRIPITTTRAYGADFDGYIDSRP